MKLDWGKFREFFHESWHLKIKPFIEEEECYKIYQCLKGNKQVIYPKSRDVWAAFKWTNLEALKAIIVGQSPYHTFEGDVPYADGLAFSCSYTNKESPSLEILYDAIADDLDKRNLERTLDLHYLAFQDVLMLNASLTIDKGDQNSVDKHNVLWQPFIEYLFKEVLNTVTGIPILLFGKTAEEQIVPLLDDSQPYMCVKHPAYWARVKKPMEHGGIFTWATELSEKNNGEPIYWDYTDYLDKALPF